MDKICDNCKYYDYYKNICDLFGDKISETWRRKEWCFKWRLLNND